MDDLASCISLTELLYDFSHSIENLPPRSDSDLSREIEPRSRRVVDDTERDLTVCAGE